MAGSPAIKSISLDRKTALIAAFQHVEPEGSLLPLLKTGNIAAAMAAVQFDGAASSFEESLRNIRRQDRSKNKATHMDRVAAALIFLPPDTGLKNFLDKVDVSAAKSAVGKTIQDRSFKDHIQTVIKDAREVLAKQSEVVDLTGDDGDGATTTTAVRQQPAESRKKKSPDLSVKVTPIKDQSVEGHIQTVVKDARKVPVKRSEAVDLTGSDSDDLTATTAILERPTASRKMKSPDLSVKVTTNKIVFPLANIPCVFSGPKQCPPRPATRSPSPPDLLKPTDPDYWMFMEPDSERNENSKSRQGEHKRSIDTYNHDGEVHPNKKQKRVRFADNDTVQHIQPTSAKRKADSSTSTSLDESVDISGKKDTPPKHCADGLESLAGEASPSSVDEVINRLSARKAKAARANLDMVQRKPSAA